MKFPLPPRIDQQNLTPELRRAFRTQYENRERLVVISDYPRRVIRQNQTPAGLDA